MTELLTTAAAEAPISVRSESERLIDVRIVPWGVVGNTAEGRERIVRGAFKRTDPASVSLEAIGPHGADPGVRLAGRFVALEDRDDGEYGTARVSQTRAGDELLALARDGVYRAASAVFRPGASRLAADGVIERTAAELVRVGLVERGAYPGAEVLAVRGAPVESPEPTPVPDPVPTPVPDPTPAPPGVHVMRNPPELMAAVEDVRRDLVGRMAALEARGGRGGAAHALAAYASLGDYADAVYADPALAPLLARALVDQITSENPGVVPPAWVSTIAGIGTFARPAVTALGGPRSLGPSGMELDWPYLDPATPLDTIVAKQAAEKTQVASVKVKILKASQPIDTYAGASDLSYQLIRRSSPSYREAYLRILDLAYNRATEAAFEAQLLAVAGSSLVLTATATADQVRAFLFAASSIVAQNTGAPATVDLVSPTEFARLGGLPNLWPSAYGTANIAGTAQASTLAINISGLPIVLAPFLTGNQHLVTNGEAAGWFEDGPFPISAEDVAKLGQNVGIWGMGTGATTVPKGIVKSTLTLVRGTDAGSAG
jgi:phage head maturation protease